MKLTCKINEANRIIGILFTLTLVILFDGASYHTNPAHNKPVKPFNSNHELVGIGYKEKNVSIECLTYVNSFYRRSNMVKFNYYFNDLVGMSAITTTGYDTSLGILPNLRFYYKNIEFEFTYLPAVNDKYDTHLITLSKKVIF